MIILRENALTAVNDKFLYKGVSFSGVVLIIVNGFVEQRKVYNNGFFSGDYISPYIGSNSASPCIDSSGLDDEYEEPCYRNGSLYSGVAYRFKGDFCVSEREYKDGWIVTEVNYRENGDLRVLMLEVMIFLKDAHGLKMVV